MWTYYVFALLYALSLNVNIWGQLRTKASCLKCFMKLIFKESISDRLDPSFPCEPLSPFLSHLHILSVDLSTRDLHRMDVGWDPGFTSFGLIFEVAPVDGVVERVEVGRERVVALIVVPDDQVGVGFHQTWISVGRWHHWPPSKPISSRFD